MARDDLFCGGVEIARAAVIAEAGPEAQDFLLRRGGECVDRGKFFEEAVVVGEDGGDASLLQHDFGDPNAIGIAAGAPGKRAAMRAKPVEEASAEGFERAWSEMRFHAAVLSHES